VLLHDLLADLELREHLLEVRGETGIDLTSPEITSPDITSPEIGVPEISVIVHDSREATRGALFCCIPGAKTDGHDHAPEAVRAGAVALLVERILDLDVPQARVDSVRRVLGPMCARFHGDPSHALRVLGITGTNGKTSTTYLLEAIARANGDRTGVIGTVEARIGSSAVALHHTTPEATDLQALLAQMRDQGVETVAMEVSSHALDQHRVDGTRFAAVAFTNLTHEHLDYHSSVDAYFEAKAALFDTRFSTRAAINIDDEHGVALRDRALAKGLEVCSYSVDDPTADVYARDVLLRRDETLFDLVDARHDHHGVVRSPLVGRFNVANALAAAATALVGGGISFEAVLAGLSAPVRVPGRFERVGAGRDFAVLVDYAHTPDALASVLDAARALVSGGKLVVVFGCGGDRDRTKRPLMGEVATRLADVAILTSDNPRTEDPTAIARDVLEGIPAGRTPPTVELDRRAAIRAALHEAGTGDVVVIAGKGHETGQTVNGVTTPFDDRVVAAEELRACR
jgi:UDP-N-acetylmuramoyl-L-alanyl-D-glutamate--2,6-diaminopimelate ligase